MVPTFAVAPWGENKSLWNVEQAAIIPLDLSTKERWEGKLLLRRFQGVLPVLIDQRSGLNLATGCCVWQLGFLCSTPDCEILHKKNSVPWIIRGMRTWKDAKKKSKTQD